MVHTRLWEVLIHCSKDLDAELRNNNGGLEALLSPSFPYFYIFYKLETIRTLPCIDLASSCTRNLSPVQDGFIFEGSDAAIFAIPCSVV